MKKLFYIFLSTMLVAPVIVSAQVKKPTDDFGLAPDTPDPDEIIMKVIGMILTFLASLAILMIVVSGIMYMTSGGDQQKVDTAKKMLTYSIVGLVVALLSYVIVKTVGSMLGVAQ